ncbi:hypothetical protein LOD99_7564 [Oopsacas minuta]|uniref:Uncharacterized protein n=1 Tax=Oopsacas minuta TaxID=111878 RepID=A0AAV7JP83_9METZ|nr:hypothetical protein LOD99_7564 [Oopsacas minuta]
MLRLDQQQRNIKSGESEEWRSAIYSFKWRHSNGCMGVTPSGDVFSKIHISEIYEINFTSAQMASWTHFDINTTQFFSNSKDIVDFFTRQYSFGIVSVCFTKV